ncbi:protein of unknown function DUF369 [Ignisphaera aggregans DSM 17230]|uniref:Cyclophilin TM1367-like domain-containing protein n=1 Tax=Ignisphaera aggregans (strain DSM 17230 / JCM 13409 / AQ1.S1) TaxID=583356 RepID=E0SNV1_IGNAA|nr:protein of unknown function DUF369 [Ignisphaera aggregans DSM 17230]
MTRIIISFPESIGDIVVEIINKNLKTIEALLKNIPFESEVNLWGEEIYFSTPIAVPLENPDSIVDKGIVAYWPPGQALCIFFGPTPISKPNEIRPASPVNVIGYVVEGLEKLRLVKEGERVVVKRI